MIEKNTDQLWDELINEGDTIRIRDIVFNDIRSGHNKFKKLADDNPYRFFELLGGDEYNVVTTNWARPYPYEEYIEDEELEYDESEKNIYDLAAQSIARANSVAHWYVTGINSLDCSDGNKLEFEIGFSEGYSDGILKTPYDTEGFEKNNWIPMD